MPDRPGAVGGEYVGRERWMDGEGGGGGDGRVPMRGTTRRKTGGNAGLNRVETWRVYGDGD